MNYDVRARNRRNKKRNTLSYTLIAIVILAIVMSLTMAQRENDGTHMLASDDDAIIYVFDVGQGDSILLRNGEYDVLIDAGPNSAEDELISKLDELGLERLDCLVLTHPHEDHIGGADKVIENYAVDTLLMPDAVSSSRTFESVLDAAEDAGLEITVPRRGDSFTLGDLYFTVLAPDDGPQKETNDYSIVLKVEHGESTFILTGDAEASSEAEMLDFFGADALKCDLLKVGHHGSSTSSSREFIRASSPSIAAISCAAGNSYGHPHEEVIKLFEKEGIAVYRTDIDGTLTFISDGVSVSLAK